MTRIIEAVYEHGVFKPLQPVALEEGQRVQVCILHPEELGTTTQAGLEEKMRQLGYKAFEDVPDEEWEKISEGWKRD
jgi:predicted DNA-binding antitoxin AbrB/MazE fold protein